MCGKDPKSWSRTRSKAGSPPHVRERLTHNGDKGETYGITPACAGKTLPHRRHYHHCWDHPRMCGKDAALSAPAQGTAGSPPHVRERRTHGHPL